MTSGQAYLETKYPREIGESILSSPLPVKLHLGRTKNDGIYRCRTDTESAFAGFDSCGRRYGSDALSRTPPQTILLDRPELIVPNDIASQRLAEQ